MNPFETLQEPHKANLLICFCDIDSFTSVAKSRPDPLDLFGLLGGLATEAERLIGQSAGRIVKYIGDEILAVFPDDAVDTGVRLLRQAKTHLERYLAEQGARTTLSFRLHYGEVALGTLGSSGSWDVIGEPVAVAAVLGRGSHRGRFVISPQVFRKLRPETRKAFHKFTPPIVYLATE